jgi:ABC-type branched-subunit amino acid transport system ATPase component/branched-subunit amino acid ABC-type transport system permease component
VSDYLPFVVIGLTTGSVYALAATGLVLTYRTSRIFNFAHGSLATVTVLLFYALVFRAGVPWKVAAALTVLGVGPAVGVAFQVLGRRLTPLSTEAKVLATIGLVLFIGGAATLWGGDVYGGGTATAPPALPSSLVRIGGVNIGIDQIIIVGVGLAAAILLHLTVEHTKLGYSMRAVVDDSELLSLAGRNPVAVQRASWALGVGFVSLSGLLLVLAPSYAVPPQTLDLLVLQAFGAAAIGGFVSLPLTYAGGLLIGVVSALTTDWVSQVPLLGGLPTALPFIVLFVVLVAAPRRLMPQPPDTYAPRRARIIEVPRIWRLPIGAVVAAALIAVPVTRNVHLVYSANDALAYGVIFLGLGLLVRTSGQVSLCQMGLAAVGASAFAHLASGLGVPWLVAMLTGALAAAAVGAVVAIPAIRVAGIYLAVATYGFGVLLEQFMYPTAFMFSSGDVRAPRPSIGPISASDDVTFYFVVAAFFFAALGVVVAIRRARLGRLLRALGDSAVGLQAQGASLTVTRVAVFALSAFLAGIGGSLLSAQNHFLLSTQFGSMTSLTILVVLLTLRIGEPVASLAAAGAFVVVPSFVSARGAVWWLDIGFGAAAVVTSLTGSAAWLPRWRWARRTEARRRSLPVAGTVAGRGTSRRGAAGGDRSAGLEVVDLSVRFRGLVAVDHLSLHVPPGRITGLIGPNGAGKTTTFDSCSGLLRSGTGRIVVHGRDVTRLGAAARARWGLGRTFQQVRLFESLTVRQNVELGAEGAMAGAHVLSHIVATRRQLVRTAAAADAAIELVGIATLAGREAWTLSTAEKRLVELARCLAGDFDVLLLDEPSSGLDATETRRFGELLVRVVDERGVAVMLVEHNIALVADVCAYVYVLDFGHLIFEGSATEAMENPAVRSAYLGGPVPRTA